MNLDPRTMMVMLAVNCLLLSGLLALAGMHASYVRGMRHWAQGSLCIGLGMSAALFQYKAGGSWGLVFGATMVATGLSLNWLGVRAYKERSLDKRWPILAVWLVFMSTVWFTVVHVDVHLRSICNSVVYALMCAACARELLVPVPQPLRTAYWFTGATFVLFTVLFMVRILNIMFNPYANYALYANTFINPASFFAASMLLLCLAFGFVLMVNYRLAHDLQTEAAHDHLTGALNRRSLEEEAERQWARSQRTGDALTVMMLDVDHFKAVNDRFGHQVGDDVLRSLARVVKASIRSDDYFARYGGEEFCIMLPASTEEEVYALAERLRQSYAAMRLRIGNETLHSTISIGLADSRHAGGSFANLVGAADQALYRAKQSGRNRVVMYSRMASLV